jgi:hypothetical protein
MPSSEARGGEDAHIRRKGSRLLSLSRYRAKRKGLEHDIDREWVLEKLRAGHCEFSGLPFSYDPHPVHRVNPFSPSIHRLNSSGGYSKENSSLVCAGVNTAINTCSTQEYLLMCMAVLKRHGLS